MALPVSDYTGQYLRSIGGATRLNINPLIPLKKQHTSCLFYLAHRGACDLSLITLLICCYYFQVTVEDILV